MMSVIKYINEKLIFIGAIVVLFLMYIFRIKKKAHESGKIEAVLENIRQKKEITDRARVAEQEFGTSFEELEEDDTKRNQGTGYAEIKKVGTDSDCNSIMCVQFGKSPFKRH